MPKILITTSSFNLPASTSLARLQKDGFQIVVNPHGRKLTENEVGALLDPEVVGLIAGTEPLTRSVLSGARNLKVLSRCGIGMDNVDVAAARELGIQVFNTPDAPTAAVAELTLGLMLDALRGISYADREIRAGTWKARMGGLLGARTVGIVGYGRIGRRVARLAHAFGSRILATDVAPLEADGVAEICALEHLLAESDIVSLHLPSQKDRGCFLDASRIAAMKRNAVLVNTARGDLVDEEALILALQEGRLAGAALDTFAKEPYSGGLAALPQVVLTAHMASYAAESRLTMEREAADNLVKGLAAGGFLAA
ncbi:MAG TPA: phosphoglycerate dehydrogenase [Methylococcaceae bacterium]|nr:phosphoglycerate dehydrogenase [Methylococcaceae bacterium]